MRGLPLLVATLVIFSGCLDFLDETEENETPIASANYEGNGPFEPEENIVFTTFIYNLSFLVEFFFQDFLLSFCFLLDTVLKLLDRLYLHNSSL